LAFPIFIVLVVLVLVAILLCGYFRPCFWIFLKFRDIRDAATRGKNWVVGRWRKWRQQREKSRIAELVNELQATRLKLAIANSCLASQDSQAQLKFGLIVSAASTFESKEVQKLKRDLRGKTKSESQAAIMRLNTRLNEHRLITLTAVPQNTQKKVIHSLNQAQAQGIITNLNVSKDAINFDKSIDVGRIMAALRFAVDVQTVNFILSWVREVPPPSRGAVQSLCLVFNKKEDVETNALLVVGCKWKQNRLELILGQPSSISTLIATFDIPAWVHQNRIDEKSSDSDSK